MKKIIFTALASCIALSFTAYAQQDLKEEQKDIIEKPSKPGKKEHQEIIIKSNGDKEIKLNVEIDGDKILINGKPLAEFKDDGITINKRKIIFRDEEGNMAFNLKALEEMKNMLGPNNEVSNRLNKEYSSRAFLGVTTEKTTDGAKIVEIAKGSAAEKTGLKNDDVIIKIGDLPVSDGQVLANIIADKKPKDPIKIYYKRAGKKKEVTVVLGERAENFALNFNYKHPNTMVRSFKVPMPAMPPMTNMDMSGSFNFDGNEDIFGDGFLGQKKLGLKIQDTEEGSNVKVIEVQDSSAAQKAGLKKDDIITEINGEKITNTDDARQQLLEVAEKSAYSIKAKRNGTEMSFEVKIPKKLKTANL